LIRAGHLMEYGVLGISLVLNLIYRVKYAKHDIAKEESSEGDSGPNSVRSQV
jgi:hypothetical protein